MKRYSTRLASALAGSFVTAVVLAGTGAANHLGSIAIGHPNAGGTAETGLSGTVVGPVFHAVNANVGSGAALRGDSDSGIGVTGISTSGTGQRGESQTGIGLLGNHNAGTGANPGIQGQTASTDPNGAGVLGRNTGGGPGVRSVVNVGAPPLAVNSTVKVTSLNADLLDGLNSTGLPYWKLGGNAGTTPGTNFLGTTDNTALELKVNGQRALRLEPTAGGLPGAPGSPNLVGGISGNSVDTGQVGSAIAGGGTFISPNRVRNSYDFIGAGFDNAVGAAGGNVASAIGAGTHNAAPAGWAFIGAGDGNSVLSDYGFVGAGANNHAGSATGGGAAAVVGGTNNVASGGSAFIGAGGANQASQNYAFVGAGQANTAGGEWSTVGGGHTNTAGSETSTVGGGDANTASGFTSTIPGGQSNTASGDFSFAAGMRAKATDFGSFVWGDASFPFFDIGSYGENTFTARTTGGARFVTAIDGTTGDPTAGVILAAGGGSWSSLSDRAAKRRFSPVDRASLLERLDRIPISRWSYKSQDPSIRHLGPTAQDFHAAFRLGEDDKHITTIDSEGVALAAIQGLYRRLERVERQNRELQARLARLERRLDRSNAGTR